MKRVFISFMCFAMCMALFAQATSLTIDNQTPGWLSSKINYGDQETVENLKVTGYVNVTDLKFIGSLMQNRNLHGCVDLSEVRVVGDKNNYMGIGSFNSSGTISRLILPTSLEELEHCLVSSSSSSYLHVDTLVFEPENITEVNGSFFSDGTNQIKGVPAHLIIGGAINSISGGHLTYGKGFFGHKDLKSVLFPSSMKYIGDCAFSSYDINGLEETNINDLQELEYIGEFAFTGYHGTWGMLSNYQPDTLKLTSVKSFNASAFAYKDGQHIFFGEGIETITTGADLKKDYGFGKNLIFHMKSKTPPAGHCPDNTCTVYVPKGAAAAYNATEWGQATIIEENPLERITITPQKIKLEAEESQQLAPSFSPADADDLTLQWSSDNPSIANVDIYGVVYAVAPGVTTIHATSVATGVQSSCEVTVIQHATDIQMTTPKVTLTKLGETQQLYVTVLPENTTDKSVKWTTTNPSVCTVTASGKIVATGYGEAVVMAITNDGDLPATCVVKVTPEKYKLTYMVDNVEYKSYDVEFTSTITPESFPTKEGYTFSGWNGLPTTMPSKDVTVTGSFTINKYKMTYMVDGVVYKTSDMEYGTSIVPESELTKEGYSFSGWSIIPPTMPARDITITGSFTKGQYKLIYIVDGQTYKTINMDYGGSITPEVAPEKDGYTFSGWSEIPSTMPAKDVTVTGSFAVNTYTLTYVVDGETYKTFSMNYSDAITAEKEPIKEGYTFSGWNEIPSTMPAKDVTVTGTFAVNTYTLTYVVDGETYKTITVNYGDAITPEAEPTKEGYTFLGWSEIPTTMPAKDVTIIGNFTFIDAIEDIIADDSTYQIYTIDGKPVEAFQKGVNIIRTSDGTAKKVYVK